jgi:hypothetical protein
VIGNCGGSSLCILMQPTVIKFIFTQCWPVVFGELEWLQLGVASISKTLFWWYTGVFCNSVWLCEIFVYANKFQIDDRWSPYSKIITLIDFLNVVFDICLLIFWSIQYYDWKNSKQILIEQIQRDEVTKVVFDLCILLHKSAINC